MKSKRPFMLLSAKRWAPLLVGGFAMQLSFSGCDQEVRTTILSGLQTSLTSVLSAFISAFFMAIEGATTDDTTQTVVKAVVDVAQTWVA